MVEFSRTFDVIVTSAGKARYLLLAKIVASFLKHVRKIDSAQEM